MSPSLILACLWALAAGIAAVMPRRFHWPAAGMLIVSGIPLLVFVFWKDGFWIGLLVLAAALSVLRWPVIRLLQRLRGLASRAGI